MVKSCQTQIAQENGAFFFPSDRMNKSAVLHWPLARKGLRGRFHSIYRDFAVARYDSHRMDGSSVPSAGFSFSDQTCPLSLKDLVAKDTEVIC